jgi:hypothetical protein
MRSLPRPRAVNGDMAPPADARSEPSLLPDDADTRSSQSGR